MKDPEKTAYGALGGTVIVEATITDAPSKTKYVWQKLQTDGTTWVDQKKFTKPLLKMQRATYAESGYYRLRAYYGEDESCTTAVAISILPPAWVSQQPVNSEGLEGQPHTIAADIWGTAPVALQWYKLETDGSPKKLSGADTANLDFDALDPDDVPITFKQTRNGKDRH